MPASGIGQEANGGVQRTRYNARPIHPRKAKPLLLPELSISSPATNGTEILLFANYRRIEGKYLPLHNIFSFLAELEIPPTSLLDVPPYQNRNRKLWERSIQTQERVQDVTREGQRERE